MAKNFQLQSNFIGYRTKPDKTNTSVRALVEGSKNVLINEDEKISTRGGYTVDGSADTSGNPIVTSFDWETSGSPSGAVIRNLRSHDDELEYRYVDSAGTVTWRRLKDGWSSVDFSFTTFWDNTELIDLLVFVANDDKLYDWSGAITTVDSATTSTIKKKGTNTWAQDRFLANGTRKVVIGGTEYTYTGGETTDTLTGVTPDPLAGGVVEDDIAHQAVRENDNKPADGFVNNVIATLDNQIYVGSSTSQLVYTSSNTDFTDFTFSSPRLPGEGVLWRLDSTTSALIPQEEFMYVSGGDKDWTKLGYQQLTVGSAIAETTIADKLKTSSQQAIFERDMVTHAKNVIVFLTKDKTLNELGRLEELETPQTRILSDLIKPDLTAGTFTNGHVKYFKNAIYIADTNNRKVFIYDLANGWWQPPQDLPVRRFAIIGGELYGHSADNAETYKLFDGTDDNGGSILANASFAYRHYGERTRLKHITEFFTEGYISSNTSLIARFNFELEGSLTEIEKTIKGDDSGLLYGATADSNAMGDQPLGDSPLGAELGEDTLPKFRVIHELTPNDFFELGVEYESDGVDQQWEILANGGDVILSANEPTFIKR